MRQALRSLRRDRWFALAVVVLLAGGLGLNITLFALVDALLLKRLPVREPERLVRLVTIRPPLPPRSDFFTEEFEALRQKAQSIENAIAWAEQDKFIRFSDTTERLRVHLVSDGFFSALGVDAQSGERSAWLSHHAWRRRFQENPAAIGRTVTVDGQLFTIAGVTPPGFQGLATETAPELFLPLDAARLWPDRLFEGRISCAIAAWLRPGVDRRAARQEAVAILKTLNFSAGQFDFEPIPGGVSALRPRLAPTLELLMGGLLLLLLMVCANVAGLLLARTAARQGELAVRAALGAGYPALVRHLMAEASLLVMAGFAGALLIAAGLIPRVASWLPPVRDPSATKLPLTLGLMLDERTVAFAAVLALVALLLFGLTPALLAARRDLQPHLRQARTGGGWRGRQLLIVAQAALATLLLTGAGVMLLTLQRFADMDPGFTRETLVTASLDPAMAQYDGAATGALRRRLLAEVRSLPGVQEAAIARLGLMRGTGMKMTVARAGEGAPESEFLNSSANLVDARYFPALGIPLRQGRLFQPQEAPDARIVNQAFASKFFPGRDPIGQTFGSVRVGKEAARPEYRIVGVVGNARYRSLREPVQPTIYGPFPLDAPGFFLLQVRTKGSPETVAQALRRTLRGMDPRLSFIEITTLAGEVNDSLWAERAAAFLATGLAGSAALIAAAGIFSLLAFAVQQRRREIAIRLALGAPAAQVTGLLARRALWLALAGAGIGLILARMAAPRLQALLYEVEANDPRAAAGALVGILIFAVLGALWPAMRAARIDPAQALRGE